MSQRVLLVYPNERDMSLVPPVIGLFSQILKDNGHIPSLFDSTGYVFDGKQDSDKDREQKLFFKPLDATSERGVKEINSDMLEDFTKKVEDFQPTLIAMSITECTFLRGLKLLDHLRFNSKIKIPTIVGGVFPTFSPQRCIDEASIDIVCVGEGEKALVELCEKLDQSVQIKNIENLWIKDSSGKIQKNPLGVPIDINTLPPIDFSIFEEDRFYRPMAGKMYRMLPIETHRGCPYTCTFCNSPSQNEFYKKHTKSLFFRKKSVAKIREEILNFKEKWGGQYIFFWADTFLAWSEKELAEFCEMYSEFNFPFWCQTRPETISKRAGGYNKLKMLQDVNLHHMSFGVEHGNEKYRREMIGRNYANSDIIEALQTPKELGITFTINNIIGFPGENYNLAFDTIELNRQIDSFNLSCSTFAPYQGTKLRVVAEERGYINKDVIAPANSDLSILTMPYFPKEEILGLQNTFVMYSKFPKSRWPEIKKAEKNTNEGKKILSDLRDEFLGTYLQTPEIKIEKVND